MRKFSIILQTPNVFITHGVENYEKNTYFPLLEQIGK